MRALLLSCVLFSPVVISKAVMSQAVGPEPSPHHEKPLEMLVDPALHRRWVVLPNRQNPGAAGQMIEIREDAIVSDSGSTFGGPQASARAAGRNLVEAGRPVTVFTSGKQTAMEIRAVALSSGGLGDSIRVRTSFFPGEIPCIIRGRDRVEIVAPAQEDSRSSR